MSGAKKLAIQTIFYGFSNILGRLINYFLIVIYTRVFLDPSILGTVYELYAYTTFLNVIYSAGFETSYFYFSSEDRLGQDAGKVANGGLLLNSILFSLILVPFSGLWADLLNYPGDKWFIIIPAMILFFDTISIIPFASLRREENAKKFSLLKFLNILMVVFFNLVFFVILPALFPELKSLQEGKTAIILVFTANLLASIFTYLLLIPQALKIGYEFSKERLQKFIKYGSPILVLGLAGMVNETLDRILLKSYLRKPPLGLSYKQSLQELGIYSASYKLSIFMTLAIQSFRYAAEPFFFKELGKEGGKTLYANILEYFSFLTAFIFLAVSIFLPWIKHINGGIYQQGSGVVPILLLANLFLGLYFYLSQWYKQTGKTIYGAYISFFGAGVTIIINIIFIPIYGYYASAYATLICYFLMAIISYYLGNKYYPTPIHSYKIIWNIVSALILFYIQKIIFHQFKIGTRFLFASINVLIIGIYLVQFYYLEKEKLIGFKDIIIKRKLKRK